jgi:hypothetical protein
MEMLWNFVRACVVAVTVVAVAELSKRQPRVGALLLSLPIVSILAFMLSWWQHRDLSTVSRLARETLVLLPLGLPLFVPLAFADRLKLSFWPAMATGVALATCTIGIWLYVAPRT